MLRSLCQLQEDSVYFDLAYQQLAQWAQLYPEDLQVAYDVFASEGDRCWIAEAALNE